MGHGFFYQPVRISVRFTQNYVENRVLRTGQEIAVPLSPFALRKFRGFRGAKDDTKTQNGANALRLIRGKPGANALRLIQVAIKSSATRRWPPVFALDSHRNYLLLNRPG